MRKKKVEPLYLLETDLPLAGKGLIKTAKEWKRIYGYEIGLVAGAKFVKPEEKTLFEHFTTLRWVKWTKRQPDWNGSVLIRWNGKWTSYGIVWNKQLKSLDNDQAAYHMEGDKLVMDYTPEQKAILEDAYWLEETHDSEAFNKYREEIWNAQN